MILDGEFESLGPKNPLKGLSHRDRWTLWDLLVVFGWHHNRTRAEVAETIESALRTLSSATALATELRGFFQSGLPGFERHFSAFGELPGLLDLYAEKFGGLSMFKKGHVARLFATKTLVEASEFVRLKTERYNDDHLAELFQVYFGVLSSLGSTSIEDLDGGSIRKRRERFRRNYPGMYKSTLSALLEREKRDAEELARLDVSEE